MRAVDMAVAQFGLDQETVVALRDAIGPLKAMKFFHQIGSKLGEDVFVSGGQTASNIPTPAAAQAQLKDLTMRLHVASKPPSELTRAQVEALRCLANGDRHAAAAERLGISESALKARLASARLRLEARTTSEAIRKAREFRML